MQEGSNYIYHVYYGTTHVTSFETISAARDSAESIGSGALVLQGGVEAVNAEGRIAHPGAKIVYRVEEEEGRPDEPNIEALDESEPITEVVEQPQLTASEKPEKQVTSQVDKETRATVAALIYAGLVQRQDTVPTDMQVAHIAAACADSLLLLLQSSTFVAAPTSAGGEIGGKYVPPRREKKIINGRTTWVVVE